MQAIEETGAAQYLRDARIAPIWRVPTASGQRSGRRKPSHWGEAAREAIAEMQSSPAELMP